MRKNEVLRTYKKTASLFSTIVFYLFLISISFVFVYPFLYMFSTSFKSYGDLINISVGWIPTKLEFKNYIKAAEFMDLNKTLTNSIIVTVLSTVGHILSGAFVGYGFSRFNFPFKNVFFFIVILSSIIPIQVFIVPMYVTYSHLNMLDTFMPFILPAYVGFGLRGGIAIFLYRQYFQGFPSALEEAAMIDGCGRIKGFFKIAFPSAGSITVVTAILFMIWHWNDYYEPSLYLRDGSKIMVTQTLPRLYEMISKDVSEFGVVIEDLSQYHEGVVMAGTAIAIFPMLIAYFVLQRKFMEGVERSGLVG